MIQDVMLDERITRAEAHAPGHVIGLLEPLVTEQRRARIKDVLSRRLGSVAVVLDAPYDPHNGAAIVRTCEAFGVQRVHVIERSVGFLAAASVARGAHKWIDLVRWRDAGAAVQAMKNEGLELVAADASGELVPEDLAAIPRVALVLGNERQGIGADLLQHCSRTVRVPMRGFVESLNLSVTAAVLLAAAIRGRNGDLDAAARERLYARGLYFSVQHADDVLGLGDQKE
jgi:tRNA (guanosine-2'-O-)-methyltransferase